MKQRPTKRRGAKSRRDTSMKYTAEYKRRYQNAIERQERYKRFRRNPAYTQAILRKFGRARH